MFSLDHCAPRVRKKTKSAKRNQRLSVKTSIIVDSVVPSNQVEASDPLILWTLVLCLISWSAFEIVGWSPLLASLLLPLGAAAFRSLGNQTTFSGMQSALSVLYRLRGPNPAPQSPTTAGSGCAGLLRELVKNQEKTMFYTVTVNPPAAAASPTTPSPNLKWKCACALSRSQSIIQRTNSNSSSYYTITYMGELELDTAPATPQLQLLRTRKDLSPVRIYINS